MESYPQNHHSAHEDAIRKEAYLLSERAGHPAGMEAAFWIEAERMVASRSVQTPTPASEVRKTSTRSRKRKIAIAPEPGAVTVAGKTITTTQVGEAPASMARKPRGRKTKGAASEVVPEGAQRTTAAPAPVVKAKKPAVARPHQKAARPASEGNDSLFSPSQG